MRFLFFYWTLKPLQCYAYAYTENKSELSELSEVTRVPFVTMSIDIVQRIRILKLSLRANQIAQNVANESFTTFRLI